MGKCKDCKPDMCLNEDCETFQKWKGKYQGFLYCSECKKAIEIENTDKYEAARNHADIFHPYLFSEGI
jgi:hypothetical protein